MKITEGLKMPDTLSSTIAPQGKNLDSGGSRIFLGAFGILLIIGLIYSGVSLGQDLAGVRTTSDLPYILLGIALLIALGFEFINGFHDTANAVATVIYTNAMPANLAVIWSGVFNFLGVLSSSGAVAFTIVSLLPVELILQVGSAAGFAMVFALLVAACIWNLLTWSFGIPNSSSHTLVGSILGVGFANELIHGASGTSGVDWTQVEKVFQALIFSPIAGFIIAGILMYVLKLTLSRFPALFRSPEGNKPPPLLIRALLIFTCTGVSFTHGSNDGQKGMGLIMLILIGTMPTAYALNAAVTQSQIASFHSASVAAVASLNAMSGNQPLPPSGDAKAIVTKAVQKRSLQPDTLPALATLMSDIDNQIVNRASLRDIPQNQLGNVRNDLYLADTALAYVLKSAGLSADQKATLTTWKADGTHATQFIPTWVKVAVALALGMGTMVGWKRIVRTVGERIGKTHMTYAQGLSAELTAMGLIQAATMYHLPVSTTHVLTSGVAGTMVANGSGLQWSTIRSIASAWIFTLPASILLSGVLFWLFRALF
jgi:PiT family inorganic phosphate transporter